MEAVRLLTDRYRLVERLGAGGMSVVWRAHDEVLGRDVAVKMLSGRYAGDAASRDLIRYEAQAAGRLSHPHVTSVYDYGEAVESDGTRVPFVVMELVEGVTLDARLADGQLAWPVAVRIAAEVAAALAAAHARGLVHRDIKPANVMLTPAGVKVVDFGIAALAGANPEDTTTILGTPAYVAPERLGGQAVTPASDVYALGLLLFRMLTGRLPWQAETVTQMIEAHQYAEPQPLPPVVGLPSRVADVCARSLAKLPEDRPSAEEVARELAAAAGTRVPLPQDDALSWDPVDRTDADTALMSVDGPVAAGRRRRRPRRRSTVLVAGTAAAVTATGAIAWAAVGSKPAANAATLAAAPSQQAAPAPPPCEVRYQTKKDQSGTFAVDVTVVNHGARPAPDWTLRFDFPADQRVTGGTGATWSQTGNAVTAHGTGAIATGGSTTLSMTGGYQDSNPIPTQFTLNNATCRAVITGAVNVPVNLPATTRAAGGSTPTAAGKPAPASGAQGTPSPSSAPGQADSKLRDLLRQIQAGQGGKKKPPKGGGKKDD
ncbi:protein kinase [Planosporangium thailandense]|uniref:non-specific serine/threonine protein kinase n=1 Tax=Planosporangium thailandense TaxID=765197 RepID=A0ABX0Y5Q3_9ACTN|nr:serine/threonine-protein kinase [Planosporangium thailandense]NJC72880.1 protein kinase [Planosporangium thailandense]